MLTASIVVLTFIRLHLSSVKIVLIVIPLHIGRKPLGEDSRRKGKTRVDAGSRRVTRAERKSKRAAALEAGRPEKEEILEVGLEGMSVQDLAEKLAVGPTEVVRALFMKGIMAQVNQVLDFETVQIAAEEFEVEILEKEEARLDDMARKTMDYMDDEDLESLQARPPVVVVMGHVDHGKVRIRRQWVLHHCCTATCACSAATLVCVQGLLYVCELHALQQCRLGLACDSAPASP